MSSAKCNNMLAHLLNPSSGFIFNYSTCSTVMLLTWAKADIGGNKVTQPPAR